MSDRRAALVDAGVELALQQCFQDLLASVDTRSITAAAGVTTGSFFHHFRNRAEFTDAVLARFEELWERSSRRTLELLESFSTEDANLRAAASSEWSGLLDEAALAGIQHLLWVAREQPVSAGAARTGGDVLAEQHRRLDQNLLPAYVRALDALRREMLPPFTVQELSVAMTALASGLVVRAAVDPDVRDDLYADLVAALVMTITRPASERAGESGPVGDSWPTKRSPVQSHGSPRGTREHIVEAAAPLFVDRQVGEVRIAEIAEVAGVSPSTVYHQFGRVSAVAAAGWFRHLPELEAIATEPLTARQGPVVRIEQVLSRYIEIARENRGVLEGLVLETVAGAAEGRGPTGPSPSLVSLIAGHVRELRARGVLRRRIDSEGLARSILQLTAMRVLAAPDDPEERIIDETLGLLLEGALART